MQISFCIRIYSVILALQLSQGVLAAEKQTTVRSPTISVGVPGSTNSDNVATVEQKKVTRAQFHAEPASSEARQVADWVVISGDNHNRSFVIIDKVDAKVFVFDAGGNLQRAAPALLGLAEGDNDEPGIGALPLSGIRPEIRTTPAGRFVAQMGHNLKGQNILWIDYAAGISMHRVVTSNKLEHRQLRLDSPTTLDNRISFGCINVPVAFFEQAVAPAFAGKNGIVYILPEARPASELFGFQVADEVVDD